MARFTRLVSIKGCPMVVFESPEIISDEIVKYNNFWEYEVFNKWKQHFPKEGLMLDIGANIGWHSLIIAKKFKKIKVYAFEPIKKTYKFYKLKITVY